MIALDTNVLVRILVGDDEGQLRRAAALLERAREAGEKAFVAAPVLCELVWVLEGAYGVPRREVASSLDVLLDEGLYDVDGREAAAEALERYRRGRGDFADYLVAALARRRGATRTYTFDRALRREPDFTVL